MKAQVTICFVCKKRSKNTFQVNLKESNLFDKILCKSCHRDHVFDIMLKRVLGFKN